MKSLKNECPSKKSLFSIRDLLAQCKIPKIRQKCRGKWGFLNLFWFQTLFDVIKKSKNIDGSQKKWVNSPQSVKKRLLLFSITFLTFVKA